MKPASAKAKGRRLQQHVRDRIREVFHLHEDDVQSRSSGAGGEDIMLSPTARAAFPFSVECKNVQKVNVWQSYEQACENAGDHAPLLVISRNQAKVLAVLELDALLNILARLDRCGRE